MKPRRAILLLALLAACASDRSDRPEPEPASAPAPLDPTLGAPVVVGTVIDARTGEPLPGAVLAAPDGTTAESGPDGRFRLRGLPAGTAGPLFATHGDRSGSVVLRPLAGGRLEVVVYVR